MCISQRQRPQQPPPPPPPAEAQQIIEDVVQPEPNPGPVKGTAPELADRNEEQEQHEEGDDSRAEVEDTPAPHGREGYPFKDPLEVSVVESVGEVDSIRKVQILASEITEKYNTMVQLREGVRSSLKDFKATLGEPDTVELTACFSSIKSAAGRGSDIDIVQQEDQAWKVETDYGTWQQVEDLEQKRSAINHFNALLKKAHVFLSQKQESPDVIRHKLDQMHGQCQFQASLDQYNQVKDTPTEIECFAEEIRRLLHDIDIAKSQLASRITTGLLIQLPGGDTPLA